MLALRNIVVAIAIPLGACHSQPAVVSPAPPVVAAVVQPAPRHAPRQDYSDAAAVRPLAEVISTGHEPCAEPGPPPLVIDENASPNRLLHPGRLFLTNDLRPCPAQRRPVPTPLY